MLARFLRDLPIRRKLRLVILITVSLALALVASAIVTYEWLRTRGEMSRNLTTLSAVIGANSTAALAFDAPSAAQDTLGSLDSSPTILRAAIYDGQGKLFASYSRDGGGVPLPGSPAVDGTRFGGEVLSVALPIRLDGDRVGTIYVEQDMAPLRHRFLLYLAIVGGVLLLSFAISYALTALAQRVISEPILGLAATAHEISRTQDYSLRAAPAGGDEVGRLVDGFNDMLADVQQANLALVAAHDRLEQRVAERTRELARSNRDLEDFAHVASHDLQEPLRKIMAFGDRLRAVCREQLDERGLDYLRRMQEAAERMRALIDQVLAFSRVTSSGKEFEQVDLAKVAAQAVSDLEMRLDDTGGRVELGELPTVAGDESQLRRVFQNLISNALKFHRPGVPPAVRITSSDGERPAAGGGVVEIRVADNGIGFDEHHAEQIFGMFSRLHARSRYEGTGVGLAIVRKIVERHGGQITAAGRAGRGAEFTFTLCRGPDPGRRDEVLGSRNA